MSLAPVFAGLIALVLGGESLARGASEIALGDIVGCTIFNALGILGVTALVRPFAAGAGLAAVGLAFMIASALLLIACAGYIAWLALGPG